MSTARWQEARALFEEALAVPQAERGGWVERRAGGDAALADEVLSLLAAHDGAGDFLENPAAATALEPTRERIGPWRVLGTLGRGGMGAVYLGERQGEGFAQRAAVKVVVGAGESHEIARRFAAERRILAALDHPGIARLLDGGTTEDGLPYFAMEYVEGQSLTEHARAAGLDLPARLGLFLEVCAAVAHAHQRLVIHRDLKPGNILIGGDGRPRLLDFGIAKLLDPATSGEESPATVTVGRWLTPAYASPEQILGEPTTTASDVYSLGVLLFELLVGEAPFPARGRGPSGVDRQALEAAPPRPSQAVARRASAERASAPEEAKLARALAGDLDTIVLKALAKEPARRYGAVAELAEDLRRYLAGRPVQARPDTFGYRSAKFLRRHRLAAGLGALAVAALLGGLTLALLGFVRAQRAEQAARAEAETAKQVSEFLVELFRINDPGEARGNAVRARELLDRGAERIGVQLAGQPAVRLRLQRVIGRAYQALGLYDASLAAHEQQRETAAATFGEESPEVARALTDLANLEMRKGRYAATIERAERAVALLSGDPASESVDLADALGQLGLGLWLNGDPKRASPVLERSVELRERLLGADHLDLGGPLNNLANLRWQQGDTEGARQLYRRGLAIFEKHHGPEHPHVASTLNNLALAELQAGEARRACELHERALALRRKLLSPDHPDVGESLNNLGEARRIAGEYPAARVALVEALAIRERSLRPGHPYIATTLNNLGHVLSSLGERAEARQAFERSLATFEASLGREHFHLAYPLGGLAHLAAREGRREEAEERYRRALQLLEGGLGAEHPDVADLRRSLEAVLAASAKP